MDGYVQKNAIAGFVTRSGADRKSITLGAKLDAGMPLKEVDGVAKVLEASDGIDAMIGVLVRDHSADWALQGYPVEGTVVSIGFIQVPVAAGVTPQRNQPVYFDPAKKVFTTDDSKTAVRAVFAANGQADGCAEIEVVQQVAIKAAAATPAA